MTFWVVVKLVWGSAIGRIVTVSLIGLAAWQANNVYQRHVGASRAIAQINDKAEKQVDQALKDRRHADRPGAAGRLLKQHCRDC